MFTIRCAFSREKKTQANDAHSDEYRLKHVNPHISLTIKMMAAIESGLKHTKIHSSIRTTTPPPNTEQTHLKINIYSKRSVNARSFDTDENNDNDDNDDVSPRVNVSHVGWRAHVRPTALPSKA